MRCFIVWPAKCKRPVSYEYWLVGIVRINSPSSDEGLRGFMPRGLLRALCSPTIFALLLASGELRAFLPVLLLRLIVVVAREGIAWR